MAERKPAPDWVNVTVEGERVVVKRRGTTVVVEEKGAPRKGRDRRPKNPDNLSFPPGAIESLMPSLREPYRDTGVEAEEGYWAGIDAGVVFTPDEAVAKLKRAGIGYKMTAKVLLSRDKALQVAKGFGHFSQVDAKALEASVAKHLRPLFAPTPAKRK